MKLKFKQSIFVLSENRVVGTNEVIEIKDKVAQEFIDAQYAEKFEQETPSKKVVKEDKPEEVEKPKRKRKTTPKEKDGE
jgi:hypothetical protein